MIEVHKGVESVTHGPFKTEGKCDSSAKKIRNQQRPDDSLFWAITDEKGGLTVGSYFAGFFIRD
jgi:hypothetical protein